MRRLSQTGFLFLPVVFAVVLYREALQAWFLQDDFAWLSLMRGGSGESLVTRLFAPMAQGTVRVLSERLPFLVFPKLFGLDPLPFRLTAMLTLCATVVMLVLVAERLLGSRRAAVVAATVWVANSSLAMPVSWASSYNQLLCALLFSAALLCLVRLVETGRRSYEAGQWVAFIAGFGALEVMAVYPLVAAAYTFGYARGRFRRTLPLFAVSLAYLGIHRWFAPPAATGPYAMHLDGSTVTTLGRYILLAVGGTRFEAWFSGLGTIIAVVSVVVIALLWRYGGQRRLVVFLACWFLALLAPYLPLRDHVSDYYLVLPAIPLAVLGAAAAQAVWGKGHVWRLLAVACLLGYGVVNISSSAVTLRWRVERGRAARNLVLGIQAAHERYPERTILLEGVSSEDYWTVLHGRFKGLTDVSLTPGSAARIETHREWGELPSDLALPVGETLRLLEARKTAVYSVANGNFEEITAAYTAALRAGESGTLPKSLDVAHPGLLDQIGKGWYPVEGSYRWSKTRATVILGAPGTAAEQLHISGYCPALRLSDGPVHLSVSTGGGILGKLTIEKPDQTFVLAVPLPARLAGKRSVTFTLDIDPPFKRPGDQRELGLVFGRFEIR